ncbi:helix-turn-helix domain-containing protein [Aquabacterium sp. A7-Y]|uniref:helix-turn-helix domain-containing protein n=1 Tax=Aquabacterium sp. A7-Y TaxID=1349605 RepID=UPI00223DD1E6|nr:helix-turn-helix transcriptional regulator [Aquabacterium sp. A7-Y]MCW7541918.1 helix-turn-helix domain-containing protein [Aquabacterium sp. A7-Y]
MSDTIRLLHDAGSAVRKLRKVKRVPASRLADISGKSRDTLHRLERGEDVSLSTFLAVLSALGCGIDIKELGRPTLEEMSRRFAEEDDRE